MNLIEDFVHVLDMLHNVADIVDAQQMEAKDITREQVMLSAIAEFGKLVSKQQGTSHVFDGDVAHKILLAQIPQSQLHVAHAFSDATTMDKINNSQIVVVQNGCCWDVLLQLFKDVGNTVDGLNRLGDTVELALENAEDGSLGGS